MYKDDISCDPWSQSWEKIDNPKEMMSLDYSPQVALIASCLKFDAFVDIGPGYSFSEAWVLRGWMPSCRILGFEPQIERYDSLVENEYPGTLYNLTVGEYCGFTTANMGHRSGSSNFKMHGSFDTDDEYLKVELPMTTVDAILHGNPSIRSAFIWADVEGSEFDVIRGSVLSMNAGLIAGFLIELTTPKSKLNESNYYTAIALAAYHGFFPVAIFNIQGTHFDCIFEYLESDRRENFENFITISQITQMLEVAEDQDKYPLGIGTYICGTYRPIFDELHEESKLHWQSKSQD